MLVALSCTLTSYVVETNFLRISQIQYIPDVEFSIFCGSIVGACLGFLWYKHPNQKILWVIQAPSLESLAAIAIIVKHEIVLAIIGGFCFETVSVIIQVISFKLTGRIFKMAPIHHHFEKGMGQVNNSNSLLDNIILALVGLATLKLR